MLMMSEEDEKDDVVVGNSGKGDGVPNGKEINDCKREKRRKISNRGLAAGSASRAVSGSWLERCK